MEATYQVQILENKFTQYRELASDLKFSLESANWCGYFQTLGTDQGKVDAVASHPTWALLLHKFQTIKTAF